MTKLRTYIYPKTQFSFLIRRYLKHVKVGKDSNLDYKEYLNINKKKRLMIQF